MLGTLGFPEGTVPDGFAIPFYFYDEFMKTHGFYDDVKEMLADEDFQTDFETQDDRLDDLRDDIKDAETPQWIIDALTAMHATYPAGQSLRYRSSTNNEDLPGFNGAGLYDSKTQHPEETEEDGISKSLKQVFASLWTFRAFTEREFHRIDHLAAAMGVLVHPNYSDELANGVAVSFDPIRDQDGDYYVNVQLGEDLVTNPEAHSVPEELLLYRNGGYSILGTSNLVEPGELLMSDAQLTQLRGHLEVIHDQFKGLYNPAAGDPFAMEIEFKITSENILAIKQARPWVFGGATETVTPPPPPDPPPPDPPSPPPPPPGPPGGGGVPRTSVPGAPTNLTAVGGNGEVVLSWDAPASDGGAAITDYEYRIDGRNPWISIGSTLTTHTVTGLVNGTAYTFEVRAVNAVGKSFAPNQVETTPEAPEVFTLDFTHFANGDDTTSDLVFVNVASQPVRPTLYFYDTEGNPIAAESVVDVTGDLEISEDGGLTVLTAVAPLGELTISTHGRGELVSGSVTVLSYAPIGGMLRYDLPHVGVAVVGASPPVSDALFPVRRQEGGITTGVAVHNLEAEPMEGELSIDERGRCARRGGDPPGGQRADGLAHRRGVPRRRYIRPRGVGALRCRGSGDVHRRGPGTGCRQPHLHHASGASGAARRRAVGGVELRAFRQRGGPDLRSGVRESIHRAEPSRTHPLSYGHPSGPARSLFLRHRGRARVRRSGGGRYRRSGDPRGRRPDGPDGDGTAGSAHGLDPRPRGAGERIGEGGLGGSHRRDASL